MQASSDGHSLTLFAPNRFIKDFVSDKFSRRISELIAELEPGGGLDVVLQIGSEVNKPTLPAAMTPAAHTKPSVPVVDKMPPAVSGAAVFSRPTAPVVTRNGIANGAAQARQAEIEGSLQHQHSLVETYTFDNFVEGKSNQLALAAARGRWLRTLATLITRCFSTAVLGWVKRTLMHAVGNALREQQAGQCKDSLLCIQSDLLQIW